MQHIANVDIKVKGTKEEIESVLDYFKTNYELSDVKQDQDGKVLIYMEEVETLNNDEKMRSMISVLTGQFPQISLSAVGIWENVEAREYQDFFYKYKHNELYYQTSDVYGKEDLDEEMTYEEFCRMFDINPDDENAISKEEFQELMGNEVYINMSGEYIDDLD